MSRIGMAPVLLDDALSFECGAREISLSGPRGSSSFKLYDGISYRIDGRFVHFFPTVGSGSELTKEIRALWGTCRSNFNNVVLGLVRGFTIRLEVEGVGYKGECTADGHVIMSLGYSHDIKYELPPGVEVKFMTKPVVITLFGNDIVLLTHVARDFCTMRKYDPYKGKGIFLSGKPKIRKEAKKKK